MALHNGREIPGHVHEFSCIGSSTATTFHFRPSERSADGRAGGHIGGWALATVNNATGELAIQSDWGNWSYRWHVGKNLGTNANGHAYTLMEFLSNRSDLAYVADKLTTREERQQFDAELTVKEMRAELVKMRLEMGREWIKEAQDWGDPPPDVLGETFEPRWAERRKVTIHGFEEQWVLTKNLCRRLYDELDDLTGIMQHEDFTRRLIEIDGHEWLTHDAWYGDYLRHRPSYHYQQLLYGILPALAEACRKRTTHEMVVSAAQPHRMIGCTCGFRGDEIDVATHFAIARPSPECPLLPAREEASDGG